MRRAAAVPLSSIALVDLFFAQAHQACCSLSPSPPPPGDHQVRLPIFRGRFFTYFISLSFRRFRTSAFFSNAVSDTRPGLSVPFPSPTVFGQSPETALGIFCQEGVSIITRFETLMVDLLFLIQDLHLFSYFEDIRLGLPASQRPTKGFLPLLFIISGLCVSLDSLFSPVPAVLFFFRP